VRTPIIGPDTEADTDIGTAFAPKQNASAVQAPRTMLRVLRRR